MSTIIYLLITMAFSAFFSGMEIAFVSVDKLRFEMERKPGITSSILSCFFRNPNNFISTMLVGNNIALVIYGILMAQIIEVNLLAGMIDNHFVMVLVQYYHIHSCYSCNGRVSSEVRCSRLTRIWY